ncbi:hypothetical protein [Tumebacillus amylolyticus]|uniref:hypothetical protein n=1 Tax=Tumebacillus amylolyticus TaxID=2801339 RepID=UPI001F2BD777|nr:hypothetical protein [Tumebacillus amylolyticus]
MLSSRYYYFLMYLNFIVCIIEFTPKLIYSERYSSSLPSLLVALLITSVMVIVFESRMNRFPGATIAQIMTGACSKSLQKALFLCNLLLSYWVGLIFLVSFAQIAHKFISPDLSTGLLFGVFLVLVVFSSLLDSKSILFMVEIVVLFQIPFSVIVFLIFAFDPDIRFDFILEAASYIRNWPSYQMIAAGTFLFNGYTTRFVFHEHLVQSNPKKRHVFVVATGLLLLLAYYLIPVGYLGLAGIGHDGDVWFTTTYSMKLTYFFIERFLVVFLMMQIGVSLMFVIVCWHSSLKFLTLANLMNGGKQKWISISAFFFGSVLFWVFLDETAIRNSFRWFLNIKLPFEFAMMGVLVWCARRKAE